jgi:dienelactone hydrolase
MTTGRKRSIAVVVLALLTAGWWVAPYVSTTAFLLDIAGIDSLVRRVIPVRAQAFSTKDIDIPTRWGPLGARLYEPHSSRHTVVVFPGVHGGGRDEPRLALLCGRLAATGLTVVCAPLPELRQFVITPRSTDAIEDVTRWTTENRLLAPNGRVGMAAVSFAGGLALVAAGRPSLDGRLDVVLSVGGYGDLGRVLRFLCTGVLPDGTHLTPHEYSLAVIALGAVERLAPPDQTAGLERGIRLYLDATVDETPAGRVKAAAMLQEARDLVPTLAEPSRSLLTAVLDRDRATLGRALLPWIDELAAPAALSPERSRPSTAPIFLLHGRDDNVIPASETPLLADYLSRQGHPVRWLLTPLVSHATLLGGPTAAARDGWALVRFWKTLRDAMD